jgi:peroxiredoxin
MADPKRPEDLIGCPMPDLVLPAHDGSSLALRAWTDRSPCVFFFIMRASTPG